MNFGYTVHQWYGLTGQRDVQHTLQLTVCALDVSQEQLVHCWIVDRIYISLSFTSRLKQLFCVTDQKNGILATAGEFTRSGYELKWLM